MTQIDMDEFFGGVKTEVSLSYLKIQNIIIKIEQFFANGTGKNPTSFMN